MDFQEEKNIEISDEELVRSYLKGNENALEILVNRYLRQIYGFVFKYVKDQHTTEDITQDVFLKVWRNFGKFDSKRKFKPWLYTIAKNTTLDYIKKKKPFLFSQYENTNGSNAFVESLKNDDILPIDFAENQMLKTKLVNFIKKLPSKYKEIFFLYYRKDFDLKEIAQILKKPQNTIKTRYRRGLLLLKKIIGKNEPK